MLNIRLLKFSGIPQVINKNTAIVNTLSGTFKQPYSLMNPVFNLEGSEVQALLNTNAVNYFEIENKFYYLMDWKIMPNNIIEIRLHLDVLSTYKLEINKMSVMLERSSTYENADIRDGMFPLDSSHTINEVNFPRDFSDKEEDGTYIMVTSQTGYSPVGG